MCNQCQKFAESMHQEEKLERFAAETTFPHPGPRPNKRADDVLARAWDKAGPQLAAAATPEKPTVGSLIGYQEQLLDMAEQRYRSLRGRLAAALPMTDEPGTDESMAIGHDVSESMARLMQNNHRIERLMRAMERLEYDVQL